jgi:hypothetical protein
MSFVFTAAGTLEHGDGSIISGGTFQISFPPSTKVSAVGSGVYRGSVVFQFLGGNASGFVDGSVVATGPQTILPTSTKVFADGQLVMRDGDSVVMACTGIVDPPAVPATAPVAGLVVTVSAQDKVDAE